MPEWLLSVISGILAGGSSVSAVSFVTSFTHFHGPSCCSVLSSFCFICGGHTHNDTQDVIVHFYLRAGSDPTSLWFLSGFGFVVVLYVFLFVCSSSVGVFF